MSCPPTHSRPAISCCFSGRDTCQLYSAAASRIRWPGGVLTVSSVGTWWRHQIETFSALQALCAGNSPVPAQSPVTRSFDVFFDMRLNKRLSKQPWGWWFETPSWSLWRQCNSHHAQGWSLPGLHDWVWWIPFPLWLGVQRLFSVFATWSAPVARAIQQIAGSTITITKW